MVCNVQLCVSTGGYGEWFLPSIHDSPSTHTYPGTNTHVYTHRSTSHGHMPCRHTGTHSVHTHIYTQDRTHTFSPTAFQTKALPSDFPTPTPGFMGKSLLSAKQNHPHFKPPPLKSIIGAVTELRPTRLFKCINSGQTILKVCNYK